MAEDENGFCIAGSCGPRAEARFEGVAELGMAVNPDAPTEISGVRGCKVGAGIDGGLYVGWGLDLD
ncbi:MAG TPA: hypothetical protein VMT38_11220 [Terracidiphilus sp.]|nr:hypothetical protein [Terracidiphilus sp.]